MKRFDLHIHTLPSPIEADFTFSMDSLVDHVEGNKLDIIAVTNHNYFDKNNYVYVRDTLPNVLVLPGIEISVEKYHVLVVANPELVDSFEDLCKEVSQPDENGIGMSNERFNELFGDGLFIVIPHYKKKPAITSSDLEKLKGCVTALEVTSDKKWERESKDQATPIVMFSDFRCEENGFRSRGKYTYISLNNTSFEALRLALNSKSKLSITEREDHMELAPGLYASMGLNVVVGGRSSGKSFFLDKLYESCDSDDVVYVKQFEIVQNAGKDIWEKHLSDEEIEIKTAYYEPMSTIASAFSKLPSKEKSAKELKDYVVNLMEYAETSARDDEYSKCPIYSEGKLTAESCQREKKVCEALIVLLEKNPLSAEIDTMIGREALVALFRIALERYKAKLLRNTCVKQANEIAKKVKGRLTLKSSRPACPESPLVEIARRQAYVLRLVKLRKETKRESQVDTKSIGKFKRVTKRIQYKDATSLKKAIGATSSLSGIYQLDDETFVEKILSAEGSPDLTKAFFDMKVLLLNERDEEVSGGQKAEYLFFKALDKAASHDLILIDEPESSFDNPFLNELIASELKRISEKATVFIATHNNVLGVSIRPDGIVYTSFEKGEHRVYTGDIADDKLVTVARETVKRSDVLLRLMEAGNEAYENRRPYYGIA